MTNMFTIIGHLFFTDIDSLHKSHVKAYEVIYTNIYISKVHNKSISLAHIALYFSSGDSGIFYTNRFNLEF